LAMNIILSGSDRWANDERLLSMLIFDYCYVRFFDVPIVLFVLQGSARTFIYGMTIHVPLVELLQIPPVISRNLR
jgi:hypothetical protein